MKGFTKGKGKGKKFIPTSRKKSALSKSDIGKRELTVRKYIPIDERKKQTLDKLPKYTEEDFKAYHDKINDPAFYGEDEEDAGIPNPLNISYPEADYWDDYSEANKKIMRSYYTKHFRNELNWQSDKTYLKSGFSKNLTEDPDYPNTAGFWDISDDDIVDKKTGLTETELQEGKTLTHYNSKQTLDSRDKQTLGKIGDTIIDREDDGTLSDHPKDHPEQVHRFKFTMDDYDGNLSACESTNGGEIRNAIGLAKTYGTEQEVESMESMLRDYERTGNTFNYEYDEMNKIDSKYYHQFKADQSKSNSRSKLSLFGAKSPQEQKLEAKEDKINQNNKLAKETEKVDKKEAKADEKTAKALRKTDEQKLKSNERSIRFLEKQIKGLQEKPAKFGVNAQSQLDVIEQARTDLTNLQSETDEIRSRLNEV